MWKMHKTDIVYKYSVQMCLEIPVVLQRERPKYSGILLQVLQSHCSDNIHPWNLPGTCWGCVRYWGHKSAPQEMLLLYLVFLNFSKSLEKRGISKMNFFWNPKCLWALPQGEFRIPPRKNEMTLSTTVILSEWNSIGQSARSCTKPTHLCYKQGAC